MCGRGRFGEEFTDPIDDYIISQLLSPKEAAALSDQQLEVVRANVRSEILFSDAIRKALTDKVQHVLKDLR